MSSHQSESESPTFILHLLIVTSSLILLRQKPISFIDAVAIICNYYIATIHCCPPNKQDENQTIKASVDVLPVLHHTPSVQSTTDIITTNHRQQLYRCTLYI